MLLAAAGYEGDVAAVDGVRGDEELGDEDSGLQGSSSGTGCVWCVCERGAARVWMKVRDVRCECEERATAERLSWWLRRSLSVMPSSKSRTSRNSRSMRPTSRLPKTPVHKAQWTFFSVESFKYFEATMIAPRNTRSSAHSSRAMCR